MRFSEKRFMKFLPFQKSRENEHCSNFEQYLDILQTVDSYFRVTHVCFSQKYVMKFLTFQMNMIIFQRKASTGKMNTVLTCNNTVTYPE